MNNEHLSDEQIMEILDDRSRSGIPFLPWHLRTCCRCAERYRAFQRLYEGLAADPGFDLPPAFVDALLDRIPEIHSAPTRKRSLGLALGGGAGALAVLGLMALADWRPTAAATLEVLRTLGRILGPLPDRILDFLAHLNGGAEPFLLGGAALLGAALLDRLLRRRFPQPQR
ncbi:MAG: hypothetical protein JXO51_10220 [Candidatus Aminicenantes bacterium]|nr:hypothetical protein [Candidatus Aminicenantes bacterium]